MPTAHPTLPAVVITPREAAANHRALLAQLNGPAVNRKLNDGTRRLAITPIDPAVYACLMEHHNWATGQCNPGYRAIAAAVGCVPAAVGHSLRRLEAAGRIVIHRATVQTKHGLRWSQSYTLLALPRHLTQNERDDVLATRCPPLRRADTLRAMRANFERNQESLFESYAGLPCLPQSSPEVVALVAKWGLPPLSRRRPVFAASVAKAT